MNVEPANRRETLTTLNCNLGTKSGERHGKLVCKNSEGVVRLDGEFSEDVADGSWTIYDTKGNTSLNASFDDGKADGRWEILNPNGQRKLYSVGFKKGVLEGAEDRWLGNGNQVLSTAWKSGKKDGLHREWRDDGSLKFEIPYKDGEQDGLIKKYNGEGEVATTIEPFDGEFARVTEYGQNGQTTLYDLDRSGIKHEVSSQDYEAKSKPTHRQCVDAWISYARRVEGDILIGSEMMKDWGSSCSKGELPPQCHQLWKLSINII